MSQHKHSVDISRDDGNDVDAAASTARRFGLLSSGEPSLISPVKLQIPYPQSGSILIQEKICTGGKNLKKKSFVLFLFKNNYYWQSVVKCRSVMETE